MKKRFVSLFLLVCLMLLLTVPTFAQSNGTVAETVQTADNNLNMNVTRDGTATDGANNYRAYANDGRRTDWGWLGLLGLIGLAGLRGRNREKA